MNLIKRITDRLRRKPLLVKPVVIGHFGYSEIEIAKRKIVEVKSMYNKHLHEWEYKAQMDYTVNKMQEILEVFTACKCDDCKVMLHNSDCAVHNEPAYKNEKCNCETYMKIIKILRKNYPLFVKQMKVGELDKGKCSTKFLSHNLNDDVIVNVKCYEDGTLDLRGKKEEYRIIVPDNIEKSF